MVRLPVAQEGKTVHSSVVLELNCSMKNGPWGQSQFTAGEHKAHSEPLFNRLTFHRKKCFFICTLSSAMTGNINMPFFMLIKHGCSQETSANPIFMHHWPLGPLAKTFSVLAWPKREYANVCVSVCMSRIQIKCPKLNWVHVREQRYLGFLNYSGMFKLGTFFSLSLHWMGWAALHLLKLYCNLAMQCWIGVRHDQ